MGEEYEIEELCKQIEKDKIFYSIMGGGVTFSGGEPLTQPRYLTEIARKCGQKGIDVAIESCGAGNYDEFKEALPYVNSMFLDIKHMDSDRHRELTGAGNEMILENIKKIAAFGVDITVRTPVIPGLNDSKDNIIATAEFVKGIPQIKSYELLLYHQFGVNKYSALGREYGLSDVNPPEESQVRELARAANDVLDGTDKSCFYTKDNEKIIVKE